jgi:hypothetical protein
MSVDDVAKKCVSRVLCCRSCIKRKWVNCNDRGIACDDAKYMFHQISEILEPILKTK